MQTPKKLIVLIDCVSSFVTDFMIFVSLYVWQNTKKFLKAHSETTLSNWKPFKSDEKFFLFHLKSYFCSEDI